MKKICFEIAETVKRPEAVALTKAVLAAYSGSTVAAEKSLTLDQQHTRLRDQQYARTRWLWENRPEVFETRAGTEKARLQLAERVANCKAFGVVTRPVSLYACHRPRLCPYCWGRRVTLKAFWGLIGARKRKEDLRCLIVHSVFPISRSGRYLNNAEINQHRAERRRYVSGDRFDETAGTFTVSVPLPADQAILSCLDPQYHQGASERGVLVIRTAAVVDESFSSAEELYRDPRVALRKTISLQTNDDVHAALRSVGSYPRPLQFGDRSIHADLLTQYANMQLTRRTGLFCQTKD